MRRAHVFLFLMAVAIGALAGPAHAEDTPRVVRIVAERFTFSPSSIRVKRGSTVEIRLRSQDTNHGFRINGKSVNVIIPKRGRGEAVVRFEASEAGRFVFECSKPCGAGHTIMRGEIVVEEEPAQRGAGAR